MSSDASVMQMPQFRAQVVGSRIELAGELDFAVASELAQLIRETADGSGRVELDLAEVTFLDSSVLGRLVRAQRDYDVTLQRPSPFVRRVLEISNLNKAFSIDG